MSNAIKRLTTGDGTYAAQEVEALEVVKLIGGRVEIGFEPKAAYVGDLKSRGHLFCGVLRDERETQIVLDDRQPEPLKQQLVTELRRVAQVYFDVAVEIAQIKPEPQEA